MFLGFFFFFFPNMLQLKQTQVSFWKYIQIDIKKNKKKKVEMESYYCIVFVCFNELCF